MSNTGDDAKIMIGFWILLAVIALCATAYEVAELRYGKCAHVEEPAK